MTGQQAQVLADGRVALARGERIQPSLQHHRVGYSALRGVRDLVPSASRTVDEGIADAVSSLLDIDIGSVLLGCWGRYIKVADAMRRTAADPGSKEIVVLDEHRISSSYRPRVTLSVDRVRVHTFEFDLSVDNDITGVAVEVERGRLAAVRGGSCHTIAKLVLDEFVIQEWQLDIDLGLVVRLHEATRGGDVSVASTVPAQISADDRTAATQSPGGVAESR